MSESAAATIAATEQRLGLPAGLLASIIEQGAPRLTAKDHAAILKKEGVDAKLSAATEIEAQGLKVRDALKRNKNDVGLAAAEAHGGVDRSQWSDETKAFAASVAARAQPTERAPAAAVADDDVVARMGPKAAIAAYQAGELAEADAVALEGAINEGRILAPKTLQLRDGRTVADLRAAKKNATTTDAPKSFPGEVAALASKAADLLTGDSRKTAESEALPDLTQMPEMRGAALMRTGPTGPILASTNAAFEAVKQAVTDGRNPLSTAVGSMRTAVGTQIASPDETIAILQANNPGVTVRKDDKGNLIARSPSDGKEYVIPPGLRTADLPQIAQTAAAFTPSGKVAKIPLAMAAGAGTQAAIEGVQAVSGGDVDPASVALAGAANAIVPVAGRLFAGGNAAAKAGAPAATTPGVTKFAQGPGEAAVSQAELADLVKAASSNGRGSTVAQARLATLTKVSPEAKAAADRLGMNLPVDVLSDSPQIRAAIGLVRSKVADAPEAAWRTSVHQSVDKADEAMRSFDASFSGDTVSPGNASQKVLDALKTTRGDLQAKAKALYDNVDAKVPKTTPMRADRTRSALRDIRNEVGGKTSRLSIGERDLIDLVADPDVTYGALARAKTLIGRAISRQESPYANAQEATLKRLYGALSEDQLANVERIGGSDMRKQLRAANLLTAQQKGIEQRMVGAFGKELDGSVANLMRQAIDAGAKGNGAPLNRLLKTVPQELHREVVATALASATRAQGGAEAGRFGLSEFAKTFNALKANTPVYAQIVKALGPESHQIMQDLATVSKRITDARAVVHGTGKANQEFLASMSAESLIARVLGAVTGAVSIPGGATVSNLVTSAIQHGSRDALPAAGRLFASPEFQQLAIDAATKPGAATAQAVRRVAVSERWQAFARAVRLPRDPTAGEAFLSAALQSARQESP